MYIILYLSEIQENSWNSTRTKTHKKKTVSEIVVLGFSHIIRAKVVVE